jgi:hypothetical protein
VVGVENEAKRASERRRMDARWDVGDPEVDRFVDASMVSFAAWDLVIYLNRNPQTCETLSSLSGVLARSEHDLLPALKRLVETGALVEDLDAEPALVHYRLSEDAEVRRVIALFVEMAGEREHRLEFVRRVLSHIGQE